MLHFLRYFLSSLLLFFDVIDVMMKWEFPNDAPKP